MASDRELIRNFVRARIASLEGAGKEAAVRGKLANLRRGIGRAPGSMAELWNVTLEGLPERFYSKTGEPTKAEWAVYIALTLYALHQQGSDIKRQSMNAEGISVGTAARRLVSGEDEGARVKRRFDQVITSQSVDELAHHLRGMVQLFKQASVPLDYAMLAEDIYRFEMDSERDRVRLSWGQDYYRRNNKEDAGSETANDNQNN